MKTARYWIEHLHLQPYPPGGYFRETYRAAESIAPAGLPHRYEGAHTFGTTIYFLMEGEQGSPLHSLKSDEGWHFYAGSPLTLHLFPAEGEYTALRLGADPEGGDFPQAVVPAGCCFGATLDLPGTYALVGCTVAPGFEPGDYQPPDRSALLARFPGQRQIIEQLTRG